MNIVTVIQARMGSSRLPNKVLMSLAGKPFLLRMVERVSASTLASTIVVATTTEIIDDPIYNLCRAENIKVFRGDPLDLLDRHYTAGLQFNADAVVKIPSDCPLIDYNIINKVLNFFIENNDYDYISNLHPATYPDGNDIEIMKMESLYLAWKEAAKFFEREHTTPYFWENPDKFKIGNIAWETGFDYSMTHRWTIDYEEDYIFIKNIYDELYYQKPLFTLYDILSLLEKKPYLAEMNKKYTGVNWYRNHLNELKTVSPQQTKVI